MKKPGCILEFTHQRNAELISAYRQLIRSSRHINVALIERQVVDTPCSRFWVSEERAWVVVLAILAGKPILQSMLPTKREMFSEIFRRFSILHAQNPDAPIIDLVSQVVNSPAPKFYMTPNTAQKIIHRIKNGFYNHPPYH